MFVLLDAIDTATASWVERRIFEIDDLEVFRVDLGFVAIEPQRVYELDAQQIDLVERRHGVTMSDRSLPVEMVVLRKRYRYDEFASHTGRELRLMLAGKKPFAHFHRIGRPEEVGIVPEALFEPYVRQGRFVRVDEIVETSSSAASRRIYYAIAGEEWRIEAYKVLWRLADRYGHWDETLERMEGYLLGYETDIDPFHK